VYTGDDIQAKMRVDTIVRALDRYEPARETIRGVGFCVTIRHARFMADAFNRQGIASAAYVSDVDGDRCDTLPAELRSGLKMIYALLCDKNLLNRPYREIASASGIALGTVGQVIDNLKELGFIIDLGTRGRKLTNNDGLFNRWCQDYTEKLKPKLLLGRFEGPDDSWQSGRLEPDQGQWGGEVAAFKLTGYLKPQTVVLYAKEEKLREILLQNRLKKTENGNIEIYKTFWSIDGIKDKPFVHPFIIYADLLEINNQRTIETAKVIYDEHIAGYFRKSQLRARKSDFGNSKSS
jgi:hypothetical protein